MLATKSNSYTFQKGGIWYFSRRVPADLRRHYRTGRIAYSLRTKFIRDARVRAMSDAAKLDRHWHILRISSDELPGKHLLADAILRQIAPFYIPLFLFLIVITYLPALTLSLPNYIFGR
jgi:hypothetical protein